MCYVLCFIFNSNIAAKKEVALDISQYAIDRKNLAAGSSDLLEWKAPTGANSKSHTLTTWQQSSSSSKIKVKEGSSPQPGFTKTNYKWSAKMKEQYSGSCPFGREEGGAASDEENKGGHNNGGSMKPRSLADILAGGGDGGS